jgi:hypothetical protein
MRRQRSILVGLAAGLALGAASGRAGAQAVTVTGVHGIQPGWVRVEVSYEASFSPGFRLAATCTPPTDAASVVGSTARVFPSGRRALLDLRADLAWLAANGLPRPCAVSGLAVELLEGAAVRAAANVTLGFSMDLPLSHLHPRQLAAAPAAGSVALAPPAASRRHAAYPPRLLAIRTRGGHIAFVEVEELPARGTVGLRGLATFEGLSPGAGLLLELGAGAELFPGWGLDVDDGLGVTRNPAGIEELAPGRERFAYGSGVQPPIVGTGPAPLILPAPPLFDEATYLDNVLNNRGVPRCAASGSCLDVVYNQTTHTLDAASGATVLDLDPGPIPLLAGGRAPGVAEAHVTLPAPPADARPALAAESPRAEKQRLRRGRRLMRRLLALQKPKRLRGVDLSVKAVLPSASDVLDPTPTRSGQFGFLGESPQERLIGDLAAVLPPGVVVPTPAASCVIDGARTGVTAPPSRCAGWSASPFRCPTSSDPLRPETLPLAPGTDSALTVLRSLSPYLASRDNFMGTCAGHAFFQFYETLLNRYADDLAPQRVIYVGGEPVTVPAPRLHFSLAAGGWNWYTWSGTKFGDPDLLCPGCPETCPASCNPSRCDANPACACKQNSLLCLEHPSGIPVMPLLLDAYWPGREGLWNGWANATVSGPGAAALDRCRTKGFWWSGFCTAQGAPPPGIYRNYSRMVETRAVPNPLADPPWSLGNTYFNVTTGHISLADRDAAIQAVMREIQQGLPVFLAYASGARRSIADGQGGQVSFVRGPTWYLPPEFGACERATLDAAFGPTGGHAVLIVGYAVANSLADPDPFNSYFVLENNWGKGAGYRSFFFMNFAAFRYLAFELTTYRLDRECWSAACARAPRLHIPRPDALPAIRFPPDPRRPAGRRYARLMEKFLPYLAGEATLTGALDVPGLGPLSPAAE